MIRSQARLDYPGVAAALRGDFRGRREAYRPWLGELTRLNELAQKLRLQRKARGTLDLDLPEAKVVLDADDLATWIKNAFLALSTVDYSKNRSNSRGFFGND